MDRKNLIIAVLAGLLVLGSLWGQVGQKNAKMLKLQLEEAEKQLSSVERVSSQTHDEVLGKTAKLQKVLQGKEKQLNKARKELVALRKSNQGLEAKISELEASLQKLAAGKPAASAVKKEQPPEKTVAAKHVAGEQGTQCARLKEELKKKDRQVALALSAGKVQIADLQKKVIALRKQLNGKCPESVALLKQLAAAQAKAEEKDALLKAAGAGGGDGAKNAALQQEIAELKAQLAQTDALRSELEQQKKLAEDVRAASAARIAEVEQKASSLAAALKECEKSGAAGEKVVVLQKKVAELEQQLKEKAAAGTGQKDDARVAELEKKIASLEAALKKKAGGPARKQFVRGEVQPMTPPVLEEDKRIAELEAALKKKDEQLARARRSAEVDAAELKKRIRELEAEVEKQRNVSQEVSEQVINRLQKNMAALRTELQQKDEQFIKAQNAWKDHLADLRVKFTAMRDELAAKNAQLAQLTKSLKEQAQAHTEQVQEGADVAALQEQLARARAKNRELLAQAEARNRELLAKAEARNKQQLAKAEARNKELFAALESARRKAKQKRTSGSSELEAARAQIIGLEKIIEEKSAAVQEIGKNLERVKINMDVLLNKISDQQKALEEVQTANRELVKELAAKNEELASLQEQLREKTENQ